MVEQYVDTILLPGHRIKDFALLNYNAMQIDVFRLLKAHEKQAVSYQRFVSALSDYCIAGADLKTLLSDQSVTIANMNNLIINYDG